MSPSVTTGSFHIVVAFYESKTSFKHYLWPLGLSNAQVTVYRRVLPETPLATWHGACGMVIQERLLLPNHGRELAAFHSYVVEHYNSPPAAVLFLHGHGPQSWHTTCEALIGKARLFYQGLTAPADADAADFARHMISLTDTYRPEQEEDSLQSPTDKTTPRRLAEQTSEDDLRASCEHIIAKWSVNMADPGYYDCCASFILPWDRILRYPKGFYKEALQHALLPHLDDQLTGRHCFEYVIWKWYEEHAPSPGMKKMLHEAAHIARKMNLTTCSGREPIKDC